MTTSARPNRAMAMLVLFVATVLASPDLISSAEAAFPGRNGSIVLTMDTFALPENPLPGYVGDSDLFTVSRQGHGLKQLTSGPSEDWWPTWSPDGRYVAFARAPLNGLAFDIFVMDVTTGILANLTNSPLANDTAPNWSPDGNKIAFASEPNDPTGFALGAEDIYVMRSDGSGVSRLTESPGNDFDPAWSPDGALIAYTTSTGSLGEQVGETVNSLRVMNADGSDQKELVTRQGLLVTPSWAPDGTAISFSTHGEAVWVVDRDGSGLRRVTDTLVTAYHAAFSPDGRWIAFTGSRQDPSTSEERVTLYKIRPDGSKLKRLIDIGLTPEANARVDWGRRP